MTRPTKTKPARVYLATDAEIDAARRIYEPLRDGNEIEIDDGAKVSRADDLSGRWVQAWVWVSEYDLKLRRKDVHANEVKPYASP